ncbi:hypothetical protein Tco_0190221, partial [Tanacetum coccineum]
MVPVQVKTLKIQAGVQVSRPGELRRHLQLWKRFGRFIYVVFVPDRNIVSNSVCPHIGGRLLALKYGEIKEMMSDHNSSDLAPQRQEMSVENVS